MQWRGIADYRSAAALRSTDRQGKGKAKMGREWRSYGMVELRVEKQSKGMAEKSADVICEGKVVHRNDSLRQGFSSDALAWQREEMP